LNWLASNPGSGYGSRPPAPSLGSGSGMNQRSIGKTPGNSRQSSRQGQPSKPPGSSMIIHTIASVVQEKLVVGENAFKIRSKDSSAKEESPEQKILRETIGLLNKLTLERFDKLSKRFLELGSKLKGEMSNFIKQIFNKACDENFFCAVYAKLCKVMCEEKIVKPDNSSVLLLPDFRKLLLDLCQKEFSARTKADTDSEKEDQKIREKEERKKA